MTIPSAGAAPVQEPIDAPFDQYQRYAITSAIARALGGDGAAARPRRRRPSPRLLVPAAAADRRVPARRAVDHRRPRPQPAAPATCARAATPCRSRPAPSIWSAASTCWSTCRRRRAPPCWPRRCASADAPSSSPRRSADPVVDRAEALVSDFIRDVCGYEQGQLQEHRDARLARPRRDGDRLRGRGLERARLRLRQRLDLGADDDRQARRAALAGGRPVQAALDRAFNETRFATDREPPCYRHFVVATARRRRSAARVASSAPTAPCRRRRRGPPLDPADRRRACSGCSTLHAAQPGAQVRLEPERRTAHIVDVEAHRAQAFAALDGADRGDGAPGAPAARRRALARVPPVALGAARSWDDRDDRRSSSHGAVWPDRASVDALARGHRRRRPRQRGDRGARIDRRRRAAPPR